MTLAELIEQNYAIEVVELRDEKNRQEMYISVLYQGSIENIPEAYFEREVTEYSHVIQTPFLKREDLYIIYLGENSLVETSEEDDESTE